jgi:hypothetical protein
VKPGLFAGRSLALLRMLKVQHSCGLQGKNGWKAAPVLEFHGADSDRLRDPPMASVPIGPGP